MSDDAQDADDPEWSFFYRIQKVEYDEEDDRNWTDETMKEHMGFDQARITTNMESII